MAYTTEFTQAQVDQLSQNIALGVTKVMHNGKMTEFGTTAALIALRDRMKAEIAAAAASAATTPPPLPSMTRRTVFFRC